MDTSRKPFLTVDEQIQLLKHRGAWDPWRIYGGNVIHVDFTKQKQRVTLAKSRCQTILRTSAKSWKQGQPASQLTTATFTFAVTLLCYDIEPVDGFTVRETAAVYGIPREYADMLQKCLFA